MNKSYIRSATLLVLYPAGYEPNEEVAMEENKHGKRQRVTR
jgi:hypothetical protein